MGLEVGISEFDQVHFGGQRFIRKNRIVALGRA